MEEKLNKLEEIIKGYGQMLVALSGGVDSVFLLVFAYKIWGDDRVAALTGRAPMYAPDEVAYATALCDQLGISHKTIDVSHVLNMIKRNPEDRCYHCKREIFSTLKERADMVGSVLADGTNADDMSDYRPGFKAVQEIGVASPLMEAGLTKAEIRQALQKLAEEDSQIAAALEGWQSAVSGSSTAGELQSGDASMSQTGKASANATRGIWEKPAQACLATRIPYGETLTEKKLEAIYAAEEFLRGEGFTQIRVRCHEIAGNVTGNVARFFARIELLQEEIPALLEPAEMAKVEAKLRELGFEYVTLDLGGYEKGKMNSLLEDGKLARQTNAPDRIKVGGGEKNGTPSQSEKLNGTPSQSGESTPDRLAVTETVERGNADNVQKPDIMAEIDRFLKETREKDYSFDDFVAIIRRLREPGGCPWDREQTHESLKKHMVEEANEALDAIDEGNWDHLCEELGDVLLQIVLHAQIAAEADEFTIDDVVQCVSEKMIRRHPHVFGNIDVSSVDEGLDLWEEIKKREKQTK